MARSCIPVSSYNPSLHKILVGPYPSSSCSGVCTCDGVVCPPGYITDPASCQCVPDDTYDPPPPPSDPPTVDCSPSGELSIINGYAFYCSSPCNQTIAGVSLQSPCSGGHQCNRADFIPTLIFSDSSQVVASQISLDNLSDGGSRSATFSFNTQGISTSLISAGINIKLVCAEPDNNCHYGITWVILTANDSVTNQEKILFNDCVVPGTLESIGITCATTTTTSTTTTTTTTIAPTTCVSNTDCRYCETNFFAPRDYGYFTVTGAGSVIFSNPNDPQDPLNGTYDINGTYTYWFSSGPGIDTYVHTGHNNGIGFAIGSPNDTNSSVDISILLGYYGGSAGSEFGIWRWDNSTRTPSFALGECIPYTLTGYTVDTTLPSELTINNPAPTVIYDIYGTDKSTCDAAGGVYSPYSPAWGGLVSYCTVFNIIPQGEDPQTYTCPQAPHIGGNYYLYSDPTNPPYVQKSIGSCCNSGCIPPWMYNPSNTDCIKYGCP